MPSLQSASPLSSRISRHNTIFRNPLQHRHNLPDLKPLAYAQPTDQIQVILKAALPSMTGEVANQIIGTMQYICDDPLYAHQCFGDSQPKILIEFAKRLEPGMIHF